MATLRIHAFGMADAPVRPFIRTEHLFNIILPVTLAAFTVLGTVMNGTEAPVRDTRTVVARMKAHLVIPEKKAVPVPEPAPVAVKKKAVPKQRPPVDLTEAPKLAQKTDDIVKTPAPAARKVRRVYGLRKVYSTGIGAGGSMADAVIGKLGNTVNKEVDDIKATTTDLKGPVASVTTVTSAPKFRKKAKPEYTDEMIANRVEGVVKVKVLVDIDGRVKDAKTLNDLGYGAAGRALEACKSMEFDPAMRGDEAVAVWIVIPVRFVMLA